MVGLLQQQAATETEAQPGAQEGVPDINNLSPEEPTPEEQAMFTKIEEIIVAVINDKEDSFDGVMKILETGEDAPADALAQAALVVFQVVDSKVQGGIPEEMLLRGAEVTLDHIIALAEEAGLMQVDETLANEAMLMLVRKAGEQYDFDTSQLEAAYEQYQASGQGNAQEAV